MGDTKVTVPKSLSTMHGNLLCALDVETTGVMCGYHEIIQIAIIPLDNDFDPNSDYPVFRTLLIPDREALWSPEAEEKHGISLEYVKSHGLSQMKAADYFDKWYEGLNLPFTKKIVPLAHNWAFERGFLQHWLGSESFNHYFQFHARCTMILGGMLTDLCAWHGKPIPFYEKNLGAMCTKMGIVLENAHDAYYDSLATAKLYQAIIRSFGLPRS